MSWPAWQLLFVCGMALGWDWPVVDGWLRRHRWLVTAIAFPSTVLILLAARDRLPWLADSFDKEDLTPATVIAGFSVIVCGLAAIGALLATPVRPLLSALAVAGRHSLACFVTLEVVHITWLTLGHPRSLQASMHLPLAAGALIACGTVVWVAERRHSWWLATRSSFASPPALTGPASQLEL
jgi:hypothetical protein